MSQETKRNKEEVFVFQQGNSQAEQYLISKDTVAAAGIAGNNRLKALKVVDLMHLVGLRNPNGSVSDRFAQLTMDDIHQLGQLFAKHTNMNYPDKIMSCCCCT
jgi:hypothetical protein